MESAIRLFKVLPVENKQGKRDEEMLKQTISRGFLFAPEVLYHYPDIARLIELVDKVVLQKRKLICYSEKKRAEEAFSMSNHSHNPFKWRHFRSDIILLCVRWYLRYSLSYRDLEKMMRERGLRVDHTTIYLWVQHYAPELERRCRPHLKAHNRFMAG